MRRFLSWRKGSELLCAIMGGSNKDRSIDRPEAINSDVAASFSLNYNLNLTSTDSFQQVS